MATKQDILRWYEQSGQEYPGWSMRAVTAEHEGQLMGLAGIYYQGKGKHPVVFSDMLPEMKQHKRVVIKVIHMVMKMVYDRGAPVLALCADVGGRKFCERLGFRAIQEVAGKGVVMSWQPPYRTY